MRIKWFIACLVVMAAPVSAQNFSCRIGTDPACLNYGDTICSSGGQCVDRDAACFNSYQCDFEGFTCKSNVTECVRVYDQLLVTHNELVDDFNRLQDGYNDLRDDHDTLTDDYRAMLVEHDSVLTMQRRLTGALDDIEACLDRASTLQEAQFCRR